MAKKSHTNKKSDKSIEKIKLVTEIIKLITAIIQTGLIAWIISKLGG